MKKNIAEKNIPKNISVVFNKTTDIIDDEIITVSVPIEIKKRGGTAMIIMPRNTNKSANSNININPEDNQKHFDDKLIKSIARAYKWKIMIEESSLPQEKASPKTKPSSLAEIARIEKLNPAYVSKIFNLNFLSPKIIEKILSGTQPRSLKLQDIVTNEIPDLWGEQENKWGF
jgi:hypothetical protein